MKKYFLKIIFLLCLCTLAMEDEFTLESQSATSHDLLVIARMVMDNKYRGE
jgi:hypothetical protein